MAFAALALVAPAALHAQDAPMEEELPPALAPDEPPPDYLLRQGQEEVEHMPPRVLVTAGAGSSLRIVQDLRYSQDRFAPAFIDLFGAFVFGTSDLIRHGAGLGVSTNLTGDGASDGVDPINQLVLSPAYLAYLRLGWDLVLTGKVSVAFPVTDDFAPGAELAVGGAYFLTAGAGIYAELAGSAWLGGDGRVHPLVSAELGVMIDYEVLP